MRLLFGSLGTVALTLSLLVATPTPVSPQASVNAQAEQLTRDQAVVRRPMPFGARNRALQFARTELFFGTAKPDGVVTPEEFRVFLDQEITPRFPDGLTVVEGDGQFRGADGTLVKEDSFILILLYPLETVRDSSRSIDAIRQLYMTQFQQESVLRVDDNLAVRVSF